MKGLKEYVAKHGLHFTEELAYDIVGKHWIYEDIDKALQKEVYYNVSGCTPGDIIYCVNIAGLHRKKDIVNFLIEYILCDVGFSDRLFNSWSTINKDFDFTPYI